MKKTLSLALASFLLTSCGYTLDSSIEDSLDGTEEYSFYLIEYCQKSSDGKVYIALTSTTQTQPLQVSVDGTTYVACRQKEHIFAVKKNNIALEKE